MIPNVLHHGGVLYLVFDRIDKRQYVRLFEVVSADCGTPVFEVVERCSTKNADDPLEPPSETSHTTATGPLEIRVIGLCAVGAEIIDTFRVSSFSWGCHSCSRGPANGTLEFHHHPRSAVFWVVGLAGRVKALA